VGVHVHTNQLACDLPPRIYALLVLEPYDARQPRPLPEPAVSRVAPHTDLRRPNLDENIGNALLPDGGYLEGPTVFHVDRAAGDPRRPALRARPAAGIRATSFPPALLHGRLAEMLYSTDDGQEMILVGDAVITIARGAAFLAWLLPQSHWVTILRKQLQRAGAAPFLLALRPRPRGAGGRARLPAVPRDADTGMMCSVRRAGTES